MSTAAKQILLNQLESRLGTDLTVANLNIVLKALSDELGSYDIEYVAEQSIDSNAKDYIESFLTAKKLEGKADSTIIRYRYLITRMLYHLDTPIHLLTISHIRSYLSYLSSNGNCEKTVEGTRSCIKSFFKWIYNEGLISRNPCANLNPIKVPDEIRYPFTDVELEKIKENCKTSRNLALVYLMLYTGCRIGEICNLNISDINMVTKECIVRKAKGGKQRIVFLNDVTVYFLKKYLETRTDNDTALFLGQRKNRLSPGGVRSMLKVIGKKTDIDKIHPHKFRRTLATTLLAHGMPLEEVAKILGHDKLDTTLGYTFLDNTQIKYSYNKYSR